jgi:electron transfer flavoprotein beta subunit
MSPYDEHAMEEAIRLKEAQGGEVVVVSVGPPEAKETLRNALAMGADSAVLVVAPNADALTGRGVSLLLAAVLDREKPDLVFAGKQAVDDDGSQVPERVAERLGWPHASVITRFECAGATVTVDREIEGGFYTLELPLPAVLSAQKGINTPRYPTLPNIMKAKKKEIKELSLADLGVAPESIAPGWTVEGMRLPRQQRLGKILEGDNEERVRALVAALRDVEKVL